MIQIEAKHLKIIQEILWKYPYTFFVFGSRAKQEARPFSDLDLCFKSRIPLNIQAHIEEDFENSNLPFSVDLVDWNTLDLNFQKKIKNNLVRI